MSEPIEITKALDMVRKVRMTVEGEARQVHPTGGHLRCNCHDLIKWVGNHAYLVGGGIEIDGEFAGPLDWIVKIGGEIRVVKTQDFAKHYEFVGEVGHAGGSQ